MMKTIYRERYDIRVGAGLTALPLGAVKPAPTVTRQMRSPNF